MVAAEAPSHRTSTIQRDLIIRLVCETIQEAVDAGRTPQQGGEDALARLTGRGWTQAWLDLFGPAALASQWRQFAVEPQRERFYRAADVMQPSQPSHARPPLEQTGHPMQSDGRMSAPEVAHGRPSAVSLLSRDLESLLRTNLRLAGIWVKAGELRRKDIVTMRDEMRERALATLAGFKQRRARLMRLFEYFENDAEDLRSLVAGGRIGLEELRTFLADAN
jgi:hypothetical protein